MSQIPVGGAILARLKALGVDCVICNSGTDFPPIAEGLALARQNGVAVPRVVIAPHEHAALGLAHGHALVSGRGQAVMLHTNVGLANGATGVLNAACDRIPMLVMSGRTPVTEAGRFGSRTVPIGWGQEMRDQAALVREACKWEIELRYPETARQLIDRAHALAHSTPKGPVYLSLPREPLAETVSAADLAAPPSMAPFSTAPDPAALAEAARWLGDASRPLVIAQRGPGTLAAFQAFAEWAWDWGVAVCSYWNTELAVSTEHPCHVGPDPEPWLAEADAVLVLDALAPWSPDLHRTASAARVIQLGPDPLFSRTPTRFFPADLCLAGETANAIESLINAMGKAPMRVASRRHRLADASRAHRERLRQAAIPSNGMTKEFVSARLGAALSGRSATVFSELGCRLGPLSREQHGSWFQEPFCGGLGWSFAAAMGAKLADPTRLVVATMGDGSYLFANPASCHQIAEAQRLAMLVLVLNNGGWGAVRDSILGLYPDGAAARENQAPLTSLEPVPDFTRIAEASRAWARRVERPEDLDAALAAALREVTEQERLALLDIRLADPTGARR